MVGKLGQQQDPLWSTRREHCVSTSPCRPSFDSPRNWFLKTSPHPLERGKDHSGGCHDWESFNTHIMDGKRKQEVLECHEKKKMKAACSLSEEHHHQVCLVTSSAMKSCKEEIDNDPIPPNSKLYNTDAHCELPPQMIESTEKKPCFPSPSSSAHIGKVKEPTSKRMSIPLAQRLMELASQRETEANEEDRDFEEWKEPMQEANLPSQVAFNRQKIANMIKVENGTCFSIENEMKARKGLQFRSVLRKVIQMEKQILARFEKATSTGKLQGDQIHFKVVGAHSEAHLTRAECALVFAKVSNSKPYPNHLTVLLANIPKGSSLTPGACVTVFAP
eukprot:TRINITY_DN4949_c0_g1_i3.p1 TRINITY_DN4949_c0_g1~~TRINITY_DN4949_c0_g1_i3.p1  ORF type:complete len:333 (+),score=29.05 TRINITY_DN4949_c0_g1_i3:37-1035(+)